MKFIINKDQLDEQPEQFLRTAGYAYKPSRHTGQDTFIRRLGGGEFPRFHVYLNHMGKNAVFNVHLDQKKPSYAGATAHSGEYNTGIVEEEVARLKSLIKKPAETKEKDDKKEPQKKKGILGVFKKD